MQWPLTNRSVRAPAWRLCLIAALLCGCTTDQSSEASRSRQADEPFDLSQERTSKDRELERQLQRYVADNRNQLAGLSENTDLEFDIAAYGKTLEISFRFPPSDAHKNPGLSVFMSSVLMSYSCSSYKMANWLEKGVNFRFRFLDDRRNLILQSDVDQEVCASIQDRS